tara:strand:- start:5369 stop:5842 length:474 start_codon:yes stop_codon:yes gene_type:complete
LEGAALDALDARDAEVFRRVTATEWMPVDQAARIYATAVPIAFPGEPRPLREFGREGARHNLKGVYRFLVRLISVPSLIERTAKIWERYHDTGHARTERLSDRSVRIVVEGHPTLPAALRAAIAGWTAGAVELTGAQNVRVTEGGDPTAWVWTITWR